MPRRLLTAALLAIYLSLALAQSDNSTVDVNAISPTVRSQWCEGQVNTCGTLCDGTTNNNSCDPDTLNYSCTCASNNSSPGLQYYTQTIPTFICETIYQDCIAANSGNATGEAICSSNEQQNCGHLDPEKYVASGFAMGSGPTTSSTSPASQQSSEAPASVGKSTSSSVQSSSKSTTSTTSSDNPSTSSLPVSSSTSSATPSKSFSTSSTSSTSLESSAQNTTPPTISRGLSAGAKAGIAIGAIIGVLALGLGAYCLGRHRSKASAHSEEQSHPQYPELSANWLHEVPQLETNERAGELSAHREGASAAAKNRTNEMPGIVVQG